MRREMGSNKLGEDRTVFHRLGIVGSYEKGPNGLNISLEKFQAFSSARIPR